MDKSRIFPLLFCALILPLLTNCSILLHTTRKSTGDLIKTGSTRNELRKTFGGVVSSVDYSSPRKLESLPEWEKMKFDAPEFPMPKTIGYDNYRYYGALESDMAGVVYGMGVGMTLGLSEFYSIPWELSGRQEEKKSGNAFRVYYAENGHWIVARKGEEHLLLRYFFNRDYWKAKKPQSPSPDSR